MITSNFVTLGLGLVLFSFFITGILIVPFINLLYKAKLIRKKQATKKGKVHLFDKMHDIKAGTPIGGGILLILVVTILFALIFPIASHMGVFIRSAYNFRAELFVIFFTFLSFGLLGLSDDIVELFSKPKKGARRMYYGLSRKQKFILQWVLALFIGGVICFKLGVHIIHIPLIDANINLGLGYIPFAAFIIVFFSNAFNITDGLDGLSTGLLAICLVAFAVIAVGSLDTPLTVFIALWIGSLVAYLYFNVWPARIMLGDAGALSFGAMLAVVGLLTGSVVALFVIGGLFVIELLSSAIQIFGWKVWKRPIFPIAPIHHVFLAMGWEEPKIVARAWLAGLMLAIFGVWLATI
jgi:phospho-N-acetylmuramoyl-pentapeptide-transferase